MHDIRTTRLRARPTRALYRIQPRKSVNPDGNPAEFNPKSVGPHGHPTELNNKVCGLRRIPFRVQPRSLHRPRRVPYRGKPQTPQDITCSRDPSRIGVFLSTQPTFLRVRSSCKGNSIPRKHAASQSSRGSTTGNMGIQIEAAKQLALEKLSGIS